MRSVSARCDGVEHDDLTLAFVHITDRLAVHPEVARGHLDHAVRLTRDYVQILVDADAERLPAASEREHELGGLEGGDRGDRH